MSALSEYEKKLSESIVKQRRSLIHIDTCDYESEDLRLGEVFKNAMLSDSLYCSDDRLLCWTPALRLHKYYEWYYAIREHNSFSNKHILPTKILNEPNKEGQSSEEGAFSNLTRCIINVYESDSPTILVIKEAHRYFSTQDNDKESISLLCSLLYLFSISNENKPASKRSMIVIVAPKFDIPVELQGSLYRLTPPYPDDEDIERELGLYDCSWEELRKHPRRTSHSRKETVEYTYLPFFWTGQTKKECEETYTKNKKELVSLFKGMRIRDIVSILSYNDFNIQSIKYNSYRENKERMVQDSGLLRVEEVPKGYEQFVGDIDRLIEYIKQRKIIIDNRSLYNPNMSLPKGILLVGPPGCGKSETTKAIASILDMPLLSLDMGKLLSKWSGESEHNFDEAIAIAEAAQPCVLRIDEIEKAFAGAGEDEGDQSMTRIIGHFLTWMQERKKMVYIVATANNLDMLRPEFLRKGRWDEIYYLSYPSAEGTIKIIESCLKRYGFENNCTLAFKNQIKKFYIDHPSVRLSGAEIQDVIIQVYQKSFLEDPEKANLNQSIDFNMIISQLELLATKDRSVEINRKIEEELDSMELDWEMHRREQLTTNQENELKKILDGKFKEDEIDKQIRQIKLNLAIGDVPFEKKKELARKILRRKQEHDDLDVLYQSKGYKPASEESKKKGTKNE